MQARKILYMFIALLCAGSCRALPLNINSWHIPWGLVWHGRALQQQQQARAPAPAAPAAQQPTPPRTTGRGVPMCMWNDVKEYCNPSQLVYLSLDAAPATVLHRSVTAAYDRNLVCNGHPDVDSCLKDRSNRCFYWNKSCVGMDAYELVNWFGAGATVNGDAAVLDFTCQGSVAMQYKLCKSATDAGPDGICNKLPGCQFVPVMKECMPKEFDAKPLSELQNLTKAFNAVDKQLWGNCEGACYVRQANACQQFYNSSTACQAKPYCVWEFDSFDGRRVCVHRDTAARGTDAFSKEFAAVKAACAKLQGQQACEEPRVRPKQVGKYRRARPTDPAVVTESGAQCAV